MRFTLLIIMIATAAVAGQPSSPQCPYDPTSVYKRESIHGFTVLVNPEVSIHKREAAEMRKELESH